MAHDVEQQLDNAYRYMSAHGWHRGEYMDDETGAVCLLGALIYANAPEELLVDTHPDNPDEVLATMYDAREVLEAVLSDWYGGEHDSMRVATINDEVLTQPAEALGILEKARARAAEQGI